MVGIAKREGSYDEEMVACVQIILHTCERVTQVIREAKQRRLVAEALRESEALQRTASESIPFDFSSIDASRRDLLQHSASSRLSGNVVGERPDGRGSAGQ